LDNTSALALLLGRIYIMHKVSKVNR